MNDRYTPAKQGRFVPGTPFSDELEALKPYVESHKITVIAYDKVRGVTSGELMAVTDDYIKVGVDDPVCILRTQLTGFQTSFVPDRLMPI